MGWIHNVLPSPAYFRLAKEAFRATKMLHALLLLLHSELSSTDIGIDRGRLRVASEVNVEQAFTKRCVSTS
jgi:hypothetical protein